LTAGLGLLEQFQRLKAERDALDFTDAEWAAWRLLSDEELGPAVLAKLDARWRHILLDEFQDTNPLQWQCLRAWLVSPANDLALAQVLRCPIFACADEHLLAPAERPGAHWYARLKAWCAEASAPEPIRRDGALLAGWLALTRRVPTHDLLDRVFPWQASPQRQGLT